MKKIIISSCFCVWALLFNVAYAKDSDLFPVFNRSSFALNQKLDEWFFKPLAQIYLKITPPPVQTGIRNGFNNVYGISTTSNDLLQGNWYQAFSDGWRFFFNTTFGLGGLIDVSSHIQLQPHYNDFGLTLAKWGWRDSAYLVLPLLGPSTIRDAIGTGLGEYISPYYFLKLPERAGIYFFYSIQLRAQLLDYQNVFSQVSFDPYVFQYNAYMQRRKSKIEEVVTPPNWKAEAQTFNETRKPDLMKLYYFQEATDSIF
jgi:phospholipid-binding lipoprotein MlaA